jgi:hypothetical protein
MSVTEFNTRVRPFVVSIKAETGRAIFYDRLDLDEWAEDYKAENAIYAQPEPKQTKASDAWQSTPPDLGKGAKSGTLKKSSQGGAFAKALAKRLSNTQSDT